MFNYLIVYESVAMCWLFSICAVRDYLGRESEAKRQTTMNYDGWKFFAVKVNLLQYNSVVFLWFVIQFIVDQELIPVTTHLVHILVFLLVGATLFFKKCLNIYYYYVYIIYYYLL